MFKMTKKDLDHKPGAPKCEAKQNTSPKKSIDLKSRLAKRNFKK